MARARRSAAARPRCMASAGASSRSLAPPMAVPNKHCRIWRAKRRANAPRARSRSSILIPPLKSQHLVTPLLPVTASAFST
eukprot:2035147-Rhodomonas_salina.1